MYKSTEAGTTCINKTQILKLTYYKEMRQCRRYCSLTFSLFSCPYIFVRGTFCHVALTCARGSLSLSPLSLSLARVHVRLSLSPLFLSSLSLGRSFNRSFASARLTRLVSSLSGHDCFIGNL